MGYNDGTFEVWANQPNAYFSEGVDARDGWPSHYAVGEALGKEPTVDNVTRGYIAPDGRIEVTTTANNHDQHMNQLKQLYPDLFEGDAWHFGASLPYTPYTGKGYGKAMKLKDGTIHQWQISGGAEPADGTPYHGEIRDELGIPSYLVEDMGWIRDGRIGWSKGPLDAAWHFGAVDDPYYDPDFDDDLDEDEFDRQIKDKLVNPPDDNTIRALVEQGWQEGTDGKAVELPDGSKLTWTPDEHGSPHHDDVLRAYGILDVEGVQYLHIDPDGETYGVEDMPSVWNF